MATSPRTPALKLVAPATRNVKSLQLKIELQHVKPKVWRRLVVPSTIHLPKLHVVLLRVMGWAGGHCHAFSFTSGEYGEPDPDWDDHLINESRVSLNTALAGSTSFTWEYDFGDGWTHKIKVERIDTMPAEHKLKFPICLAGAGACPPEDVGGPPGYEDFVQAMANPNHPEHASLKQWYGRPFDPNAFDVQQVQDQLYNIAL